MGDEPKFIYGKGGPKFKYKPEMLPKLLKNIQKAKGSLGQTADLSQVPRRTFYDWIRYGDADADEGRDTEFVELSRKLREKQTEVIMNLAEEAQQDYKSAKFIMWWLSKVAREDFGEDGVEIRQLREMFEKVIQPMIERGQGNAPDKVSE